MIVVPVRKFGDESTCPGSGRGKLDTFWIVDVFGLTDVSVTTSPVKVSKLAGMVTVVGGVLVETAMGPPKFWMPVPSVSEMLDCNCAAKRGAGKDRQ